MDAACAPKPGHRKLIYFPIVHNMADMGALRESVKEASVRKIGRRNWRRKQDVIEGLWQDIESALGALNFKGRMVRIYQDGLPLSGRTEDIVKDLADSGSRNHQLLLRLIERGAQLMGTESAELLLEEYELAKQRLSSDSRAEATGTERPDGIALLQKRDKFIAQRINDTLEEGEIGIVFLGMLHALDPWLEDDIRVVYPIGRPRKAGIRTSEGRP
ncbi:MAG: hypothetical protein V1792_10850 [Pseudomonadota bacterium]